MTDISVSLGSWRERLRGIINRLLEQRWTNIGLRAKMGLMVEVGLLGLIAIFLFLSVSSARQTTQKIMGDRMMLARLSAASLDLSLRQIQSELTILGGRENIRSASFETTEWGKLLDDALRQLSPAITSLRLINPDGALIASAGSPELDFSAADLAVLWDEYETEDVQGPSGLHSMADASGKTVVHLMVKDENGHPIGFLLASLDLKATEFSPLMDAYNLGDTGKLDVINSTGRVLLSSKSSRSKRTKSLIGSGTAFLLQAYLM